MIATRSLNGIGNLSFKGQSFLIAALLLQMPEEQAFGVLVKVNWKIKIFNKIVIERSKILKRALLF